MAKLLMITGLGSAVDLASGRKGAFYNTLEEFHKYWDRVDIICPRINSRSDLGSAKRSDLVLFGNVYVHISPWPLVFHPFWFLKKGLEIHKEQKFDLMTVHEFPPFYNGIGAWIVSVLTRVPYVLEIHHIPGYPKAGSFKEKIYRYLMSSFIRFDAKRAKAVRVVNKKETPEFLIKAGVPEKKIVYIPSMYIDLNIFKPTGLSKKYDLIFIGRLVENKGINLLFDAVAKIRNNTHDLKVVIVGEGPLGNSLKNKIGRLNLKDNVLMYGRAKDSSEIARLLNESRILVMPSYNEGGPRVVVEAMACGVPVLATKVGLIPDFAYSGAVKIIDWNAEDIAKNAKNFLENENEMARMAVTGIEIAKQFEKEEAIKNYAERLKTLLG